MRVNPSGLGALHARTPRRQLPLASDLLRTYRNLAHPLAEKRVKHSADFGTADLCWTTVNAVLNDLAASSLEDREAILLGFLGTAPEGASGAAGRGLHLGSLAVRSGWAAPT